MSDSVGRHHDDVALNQLESLVFTDHPRIHHAADVVDGERAAGKTFGCAGECDIHGINITYRLERYVFQTGSCRPMVLHSIRPEPSRVRLGTDTSIRGHGR